MATKQEEYYFPSLPVPSVQHLTLNIVNEIPDRYIRPEFQSELVCTDDSFQIPVIDFSKILNEKLRRDEMTKLHAACEEWGFFQLINHGSEETIEMMKNHAEEFFKQPLEEKKAYAQEPHSMEGYGQAFVQFEDQKLDWGDMYLVRALPVGIRNMKFWPKYPNTFRTPPKQEKLPGTPQSSTSIPHPKSKEIQPGLLGVVRMKPSLKREIIDRYSTEVNKLAIQLVGMMAENLGIEAKQLTGMLEDVLQPLRMNYYPPCPQADKVVGISPHSDPIALTLLIETNNVQGLQIRKNGMWVPVHAIPSAFIVNIGDMLEIWTNGKYKSIEHRVVVNHHKERLSVAAFHAPNNEDVIIGPRPDLVKEGAKYYKSTDLNTYYKLNGTLQGKKHANEMKLVNTTE
ncbi:hypothetical protein Scep_026959 [Stephania cephalantha]|uniref:Fe2OG dioxygenase domain-containing protein n=1 Tax=Stephania cephalantha TaxID=152367 RepID=A0AAP0HTR6_9MAGN